MTLVKIPLFVHISSLFVKQLNPSPLAENKGSSHQIRIELYESILHISIATITENVKTHKEKTL